MSALLSPDLWLLPAVLLSLIPATAQYTTGRALLRHRDDPLLPDLVLARARRVGTVTAVSLVAMLVYRPGHGWWLFPLALVMLIAAAYPLRRSLFGDRWGFGSYFRFSLFSGVAMLGFWLLLAHAPGLILGIADGRADVALVAGLVLAVLLVSADRHYAGLWLALHRAEPVADAELAGRFDAMVARAGLPRVHVRQVGPPGSRILNAAALPSARVPAVAIGRAIVEEFTPDESCAIVAHEVAHLEHFSGSRLRTLRLVTVGLIAAATLLPAAVLAAVPAWAAWLPLLLLAAVVGVVISRSAASQANETASDLRAVELCGDADALISALTRLHVESRIPRQWPHELEPTVSHPSLSRRIAAISERAAVERPRETRPTLVHGLQDGVRILLDENRIHWLEGVAELTPDDPAAMREAASSYRAIAYGDLAELRVVARGAARSLRATTRTGEQWTTPISAADAGAVQRVLDVVDVRLGRPSPAEATGSMQLLASGLGIALLIAGQFGLPLVAALLVLIRPRVATLAAMGAMALVQGAITLALEAEQLTSGTGLALVLVPVIGVTALGIALVRARAGGFRGTRSPYVLLLAVAGVWVLVLTEHAIRAGWAALVADPLSSSLALVLVGVGAACLALRSPRWRRTGVGLAAAAAAAAVMLTVGAALSGGPPIRIVDAGLAPVAELPIAGVPYQLELSPGGVSYAHRRSVHIPPAVAGIDGSDGDVLLTVGRLGGDTRMLALEDAAFIDEETLLVLSRAGDSLELRVEDVRGPRAAGWRIRLPELATATLLFDAASGRWTVVGRRGDGVMAAHAGVVGMDGRRETTWGGESVLEHAVLVPDDESFVVASFDGAGSSTSMALAMLGSRTLTTRLSRRTGDHLESLGTVPGFPSCRGEGSDALCITEHGGRTRLWRVSGRGAPVAAGTLPRGYSVRNLARSGGIAALSRDGGRVVLSDAARTDALRVTLPPAHGDPAILDVQTAGDVLLVLRMTGTGSASLSAYRVHQPVPPALEERARTARHPK